MKQTINVGTGPNTNTGDSARVAAQKINANFDELYAQTDRSKGYYDPVTNMPPLANGAGEKGDYYTIAVNGDRDFGAGLLSLKKDDRIAYDGLVWYKAIDNNQQSSFLPIYHEVLSSSLTTQDVTGLRNYLNALTPNIAIPSNAVLKVIVTNTGQLFEVKVNGRTIGSGQTALQTSDIALLNLSTSALSNTFLPKVSTTGVERVYTINANGSQGTKPFKDCRLSYGYNSASVTGTTAITKVLGGLLVPSKAFESGDSLTLRVRMIRTVPDVGTSTVYVYCSTSATVTSITDPSLKLVGFFAALGGTPVVQGKYELAIKNPWSQTEVLGYSGNDDDKEAPSVSTISIVWPADVYFYVFIGNTQTTTSAYVSFFELYKK